MKLSVIIPAYNERATIAELVRRVKEADIPKEIIIVDDGSTDGTRDIVQGLKDEETRIVYHPYNRGKGMAIRTGIKQARGDIIVIQDADLEYDPNDYHKLIEPIIEGKAKVVYGSRFLASSHQRRSWSHYLGIRVLTWFTNLLYRTHLTDEATCYKAFRADVLKSIKLDCQRFEFCPEVTAKVRRRKIAILEVPISYNPRTVKEGKKIRLKDGLVAIYTLLRYRFGRIDKGEESLESDVSAILQLKRD